MIKNEVSTKSWELVFARLVLSSILVGGFTFLPGITSAALPDDGWTATSTLDTSATTDLKHDDAARVATDGAGNWVAVWQASGIYGTDFDILASRSSNDGATWSSPAPIVSNANSDTSDDLNPTVTSDRHGNWLIAWQANNGIGSTLGSDQDILCVRSTNNGQVWSFPIPLNLDAAGDTKQDVNVALASDTNNTWVATWTVVSQNVGQRLYCSTSTSQGAAWSLPVQVDTKALTPTAVTEPVSIDLATDTLGTWVIAVEAIVSGDFDIVYYRSTDSGINWISGGPVSDSALSDSGGDFAPRLATDGRGNWMVVWYSNDSLGETKGFDEDILVARTSNIGAGWETPKVLNTQATNDTRQDRLPYLVTDTFGNWVTLWNSNDDTFGSKGLDYDILFSRSTNNGRTWSPQTLLNDHGTTDTGVDARGHMAASGLGTWIATWHTDDTLDNTIGDEGDILYARAGFMPIVSDLQVQGLSDPAVIFAGLETIVSTTVTNNGPSTAEAILLTQSLPSGSVLISSQDATGNDCILSGTQLICDMGSLPDGESATAHVQMQLFTPGVTQHFVAVSSDAIDLVENNNSTIIQTTVNSLTDVTLEISDSIDPALQQKTYTYTVTAHNSGPSPAEGVDVLLTLPAHLQLVGQPSGPGSWNTVDPFALSWSVGSLDDDESAVAVITVRPMDTQTAEVQGTIQTTSPESNANNNSASQSTEVIPAVDLVVTLVDTPDPVFVTRPLTLTAHVYNGGPADATDATVSIPTPVNCTYISANGAPVTQEGAVNLFALGTVAANTTTTVAIVVEPQATGNLSSAASADSTEADANETNNSAQQSTTVRPPADLEISISPSATTLPVLGTVTYTVLVTNHGPSNATEVVVAGDLSSKFDLTIATTTKGSYTTGTWSVGTVLSGQTAELVLEAKAFQDGATSLSLHATLAEFDNVEANNTNQADVLITSSGAEINGFWLSALQKCIARKCQVRYKFVYGNTGIAHSQPARMRIYLSQDQVIDPGDLNLSEVVLFPRAKNLGKTRKVKRAVKLPAGVVATGKYLIAVLDADSNVGEQNERNNVYVSSQVE